MPRKRRNYLPGIPVHIVHRGNNRQATFYTEEDYLFYLESLQTGLQRYGGSLHAYCLMTNHVHLLITPDEEDSIPRILQHIGRMYVRYINKVYRRSGTLWEGRHKSSMVDAEHYLLKCYRYIELNPVTAGMVSHPGEYHWSSYGHHAQGQCQPWISEHLLYLSLGTDSGRRCFHYRELFRLVTNLDETHIIRKALECNYPLGNERFRADIEHSLNRSVGYMKSGRPSGLESTQK